MKVSKIIASDAFKAGVFEAVKKGYSLHKASTWAIGYACGALGVHCDEPTLKAYTAAFATALLLIEEAQA